MEFKVIQKPTPIGNYQKYAYWDLKNSFSFRPIGSYEKRGMKCNLKEYGSRAVTTYLTEKYYD